MTEEELNTRFGEMSNAIAQLAQAQIRMEQGQAELRQVVMEARADMAQFTNWAEIMTQAVEELRAGQTRHEQFIERIDRRQAESDQRFEVLLKEIRFLIRQQPPAQNGDEMN